MINSSLLLSQLQSTKTSRTTMVKRLEDDLRKRCDEEPTVDAPLKVQYEAAKAGKRTALTYKAWREDELTNIAVAWVLACVFIRFLEDNELVEVPKLSGPGARLQRARDEHELFFRQHPTDTEREYLLGVFDEMGRLPGMKEFFDKKHNPLWLVAPSGDACRELWQFWQKTDAVTGALVHDFTDPEWNTRFLGDLYQDLSEAARKRYALLQTPVFIEQFILDRTLTPAIETFGFREVRMIDPTCGSAHFLLGGFDRLFRIWQAECPGENPRVLAQRALDQMFGVDLNPNVVGIARFRLLLAALKACGEKRLKDAPDFRIHVAAGDALLHGRRFREMEGESRRQTLFESGEEVFRDELKHHYEVEDVAALHRILGQQYHAVVGNPPYITVKDRAVSELYRARFLSCAGKYSLSVPFMERFFDLALKGDGTPQEPAGFVGQITANSFMKREFGKKLIEEYLPRWDLTHVLDTSGAYIPGHGTPTVILFGKNQPPVSGTIRTVLGIRGEPATPDEPASGLVWQALCQQVDQPGSESEWVSGADSPRAIFHKHPWSIGGGGAAELKEEIAAAAGSDLASQVESIGIGAVTGEDDAFAASELDFLRGGIPPALLVDFAEGDIIRDWLIHEPVKVIFPYDENTLAPRTNPNVTRFLWPLRTGLKNRLWFRKTQESRGMFWWEYGFVSREKFGNPSTIGYAEIASHNHFVFVSSRRVFKQTAPIIKLKKDASEEDHLRLLGLLNSSTIAFMMKQTSHQKQMTGGDGVRVDSKSKVPYQFGSTQLHKLPVPTGFRQSLHGSRLSLLSTQTVAAAVEFAQLAGREAIDQIATQLSVGSKTVEEFQKRRAALHAKMIFLQEQIDFAVYAMFGFVSDELAGTCLDNGDYRIEAGQRAFEICTGTNVDGFPVPFEPPKEWDQKMRSLWAKRIEAIKEDATLRLLEDPNYKRRWIGKQGLFNHARVADEFRDAARDWLLARLEGYFYEGQRVCDLKGPEPDRRESFDPTVHGFTAATGPHLVSANQLADVAQTDKCFMEVAENYEGSSGFSVPKLVRELVESESVPYLPIQRYKESGLRKREDWEHVWDLQRREDKIDAEEKVDEPKITDVERLRQKAVAMKRKNAELGDIPVPPKYASTDFKKDTFWKLRGKLDVPKERWVSYPGAERAGDDSLLIAWAGWDHLQQAQALAEYYLDAKDNQGWQPSRLKPLLAGLADLIPWLKQWHNTLDPNLGMGLGDYFAGFLDEQCRGLEVTVEDVNKIRTGE